MTAPQTPASVTVITGGAGTLGTAMAERMSEESDIVVLLDRDEAAVGAVAAELADRTGRSVVGWRADVSDEGDIQASVDRIAGTYGRLDRLVNNAAINRRGSLADQDPLTWDEAMAVNLRGPMLLCRAALSLWHRTGWGRVVNIASRTWLGGGPTSYVTSKAGVVGLTRTLAVELGPFGVTVNAVAPSMIATGFTTAGRDEAQFRELTERHLRLTPMGRLATPADVAEAVAFLASDKAGFITGEVLHVCGGAQLAATP
ncbi:SDR family NAD(P)-dependent oxidoreductase [Actinoallomurus iriomotensis]|uniref:3-ketoacyl-ACP reductase n=1 Tax=Actinoallomurus iriomotensis TaxID=478107 RepID=A0A9W6W1K2_9ACTN|nr:SDR family oxidoreductase [Actinoallomurus iriomotensis]GLY87980.1 3-ketoacyl-ACP reductase [Actinoallomurus iriomotensis]